MNFCSDYKLNTTINVNSRHYPAAEAGPGVIKSIWLLLLAMLFKAIITVFTFGVKVRLSQTKAKFTKFFSIVYHKSILDIAVYCS